MRGHRAFVGSLLRPACERSARRYWSSALTTQTVRRVNTTATGLESRALSACGMAQHALAAPGSAAPLALGVTPHEQRGSPVRAGRPTGHGGAQQEPTERSMACMLTGTAAPTQRGGLPTMRRKAQLTGLARSAPRTFTAPKHAQCQETVQIFYWPRECALVRAYARSAREATKQGASTCLRRRPSRSPATPAGSHAARSLCARSSCAACGARARRATARVAKPRASLELGAHGQLRWSGADSRDAGRTQHTREAATVRRGRPAAARSTVRAWIWARRPP